MLPLKKKMSTLTTCHYIWTYLELQVKVGRSIKRGGENVETNIKAVLRERKMTVHALHLLVRGNRAQLYNICNGFSRATVPMREKVAAVLGLPIDELFDEYGMAKK